MPATPRGVFARLIVVGGISVACMSSPRTDHADAADPAASRGAWPNEPAGYTVLTDNPFDFGGTTSRSPSGWTYQATYHHFGSQFITTNAAAPVSPPNVLQADYPVGFVGGYEPGESYYYVNPSMRQLYIGFAWYCSNPWQEEVAGVNKILFIKQADFGSNFIFMMNDIGGTYPPRHGKNGTYGFVVASSGLTEDQVANSNGDSGGGIRFMWGLKSPPTPITLGTWYKIEILLVRSTTATSEDGILKWWVNGVLQAYYANVNTPRDWNEINIAPTWGGGGATKTEHDYFLFDHIHISGR
jgi:hypothetical protein